MLADTTILSEAMSHRGLAILLDVTVKAVVVLAAAGAVALLLRRRSAAARHMVWSVAALCLLAMPVLSASLPHWNLPVLPNTTQPVAESAAPVAVAEPASLADIETPFAPTPTAEVIPAAEADPVPPAEPAHEAALPPVEAQTGADPAEGAGGVKFGWAGWTILAYLAGVLASATGLAIGTIVVRRRHRGASALTGPAWRGLLAELAHELDVRRPVTMLRASRSAIPITWGLWKPVILLPAEVDEWSDRRKRLVLLHELGHVKRGDCLWQLIAQFARTVHWYNPLVWLATRRLRIERERAADDLVLAAGARPSDYADLLLDIARSLRVPTVPSLSAVAMARKSSLESRLLAILDATRPRRGPGPLAATVAVAVGLCVLAPLAALHPAVRQGTTIPFPPAAKMAGAEEIHSAALAWLRRAEGQVDKLVPVAEAAVDTLGDSGRIYVAGNAGFCEDLHYRGGGLSGLEKWDRTYTKPADVVLIGHFKQNDTGLIWHRFDEFYRYLNNRGGMRVPMVVHFTSLNWPKDRKHFELPDQGLWDNRLYRIDTGAPPGGKVKDRAISQFATLAMAWAFQAEMMAAATRSGKVLGTYSHDVEPDSAQWDASVRGKVFLPGRRLPAVEAGKLGKEYLRAVAAQVALFSTTQTKQLRLAANRMAAAVRNGKTIWLVHSLRTFQSDCVVPADLPIAYLGYDWNMNLVAPRLPAGDVLLYVAGVEYPAQTVATARERGLECVVISAEPGPAQEGVVNISGCWKSPDSVVPVPGYPRKVLPISGVVQTLQWYSILAETAAALESSDDEAATPPARKRPLARAPSTPPAAAATWATTRPSAPSRGYIYAPAIPATRPTPSSGRYVPVWPTTRPSTSPRRYAPAMPTARPILSPPPEPVTPAAPPVRRRIVNKKVTDFPDKVDLSTPETALAASPQEASAPAGRDFRALLPGKASVELIGVSMPHADQRQWWRPDGTLLDAPPYPGKNDLPAQYTYEFVMRVSPKEGISETWSIPGAGALTDTGSPKDEAGEPIADLRIAGAALPAGTKTATVRFAVAAGPWGTLAAFPADRKNALSHVWTGGGLVFNVPQSRDGKTVINVANTPLDKARQLVAVLKEGAVIHSSVSGVGVTGLTSHDYTFPVPPDRIERFEFQTRPYQWVTFKDVSLVPGQKTSVAVIADHVGAPPAEIFPGVRRRYVGRKVTGGFPDKVDLSTPETALAAYHRASARQDIQGIAELSWVPIGPGEADRLKQMWAQAGPESMAVYNQAQADAAVLEVLEYKDGLAQVISLLAFPPGKGSHPYSARGFGLNDGQWKNLGEDRLPSLEAARENFNSKKDRLWAQYQSLTGAAPAE